MLILERLCKLGNIFFLDALFVMCEIDACDAESHLWFSVFRLCCFNPGRRASADERFKHYAGEEEGNGIIFHGSCLL